MGKTIRTAAISLRSMAAARSGHATLSWRRDAIRRRRRRFPSSSTHFRWRSGKSNPRCRSLWLVGAGRDTAGPARRLRPEHLTEVDLGASGITMSFEQRPMASMSSRPPRVSFVVTPASQLHARRTADNVVRVKGKIARDRFGHRLDRNAQARILRTQSPLLLSHGMVSRVTL